MNQPPKRLTGIKRKQVRISQKTLIKQRPLFNNTPLPLLIEPATDGVDLITWAKENYTETIVPALIEWGGILFRGFRIADIDQFQQIVQATTHQGPLEYTYRSTPRSEIGSRIYTSTHYPADQAIPLHNENVYTTTWPMKIWFCCLIAAQTGGATPIADSRKIYQRIDPAIRAKFDSKKVMYVRNYSDLLDLPWQEVFQTNDKTAVAAYCQKANIEFKWQGEQLTTRQRCQATARHPQTGEMVWCNQAHLFHISSLPETMRHALLTAVGSEDKLPRHAVYGDGTPIEADTLTHIRAAIDAETVAFPWQVGDVLMLDNMLVAHGRQPFTGERRIIVSMAEPYQNKEFVGTA